MRKRFVAALAVMVACALTLAGCNAGGSASDPTLGRYEGYAVSIGGSNEPIEDTYDGGENYVELQEGGAVVICLDGNPLSGTYTLDGENITLVIKDEDLDYNSEGTVKDGVLSFDFLGLGLELTFVKDGVEKPFEVTSREVTETESTTTETDSAETEGTEVVDTSATDANEADVATSTESESSEDAGPSNDPQSQENEATVS